MEIIKIIESARHKELLKAFENIKPIDNSKESVKAIADLGSKIELFIAAVKSIPAPNVKVEPIVNVEPAKVFFDTNNINILAKEILDSLNDIKNRPTEWVHTVTRDRSGMISKITSKAIKK